MIPASFDYARPGSVEEAVALLAAGGGDAKLLAGGQSLIPLLKLRLAAPALLVDVGRLDGLRYVRDLGDHLAIGALTRHHELAASPLVREHAPLLAAAAEHVGDPQVRHRGTIGGSLAHADPAGDLPAAVLAYDGALVAQGPAGERTIPAADFFTGMFESTLDDDELLREIRVPKLGPRVGWSFLKFTRRAIDWATVGVAALHGAGVGRVALISMGSTPLRALAVEERLAAGAPPAEAAEVAAEGTEPTGDAWASAWYRQHLARVLVGRALQEAAGRAQARST